MGQRRTACSPRESAQSSHGATSGPLGFSRGPLGPKNSQCSNSTTCQCNPSGHLSADPKFRPVRRKAHAEVETYVETHT